MAPRPCGHPGCSALVARGYCPLHTKETRRYDERRGSSAARGYGYRWQKASKAFLLAHPIAVDWFKHHGGRPQLAKVVDHIIPHRGDMKLFWDPNNWQPMTKADHDRKTAEEDGGFGRVPAAGTGGGRGVAG